jgi:hypothetical protein
MIQQVQNLPVCLHLTAGVCARCQPPAFGPPPEADRLSDADVERIAQRVTALLTAAREGRDRRL